MQAQPALVQKALHLVRQGVRLGLAVAKQRKVVQVAQIAGHAQHLFNPVVQRVHHHVAQPLAGQVAQRQAAPAQMRGEQIIPGVVAIHRLLRVGPVDHRVQHGQGARASHKAPGVGLGHRMVDGRKKPVDVAAQHPGVRITKLLIPRHRPVLAAPGDAGKTVGNKAALRQRPQHAVQGVVHHPVSKRGDGDVAGFGLMHHHLAVATRAPGAGVQRIA